MIKIKKGLMKKALMKEILLNKIKYGKLFLEKYKTLFRFRARKFLSLRNIYFFGLGTFPPEIHQRFFFW